MIPSVHSGIFFVIFSLSGSLGKAFRIYLKPCFVVSLVIVYCKIVNFLFTQYKYVSKSFPKNLKAFKIISRKQAYPV